MRLLSLAVPWKCSDEGGLGTRVCPLATTPVSALEISQSVICLQAANEVREDDDEFEAYRKRMMLGYKHRCGVPA